MCGCRVERKEVRGCLCEQRVFDSRAENLEIDNAKANGSLEEGCSYTFLRVLKNVNDKKTELFFKMKRRCTCKGYLLSGLSRSQTTTEWLLRNSMLYHF